jgi:hypothetical protein
LAGTQSIAAPSHENPADGTGDIIERCLCVAVHGAASIDMRAKSLSDNIRLDVTIVILASPDNTTVTLDNLSNHVINKTVLVINSLLYKLSLVVFLVKIHEDVLE